MDSKTFVDKKITAQKRLRNIKDIATLETITEKDTSYKKNHLPPLGQPEISKNIQRISHDFGTY